MSIQQRLQALQQQNRIAAASLIVTVFGDAVLPRGGSLWLGSLIALMDCFGVNERLVRTSVFRLVQDDWLHAVQQGRRSDYRLTEVGRRRFDDAAAHIYAAQAPRWDQLWRLLVLVGEVPTRQRDLLRRALRWQGFGELSPTTFVHPGADLETTLQALQAEGLGSWREKLLALLARDPLQTPAAHAPALVQQAWDLPALAQGYDDFLDTYRPLLTDLRRSRRTDPRDAFMGRTLLIHDYRRLLLRDPQLPSDLLPAQWPGETARTLCATLYGAWLQASEQFLDERLQLADGSVPAAGATLTERFAG